MSAGVVTMAVGGLAGFALAAYGTWILITGRAPGPTARTFRCPRDAGFYHLLFGVSLALLLVGTGLDRSGVTLGTTLLAIVLAAVAVFRFRPRGRPLSK